MRIVIAGAGIGGLTAAVAIGRAGHEAHVLERAPELRPIGAGLTIQPNALSALDDIGLGDAVRAAGARLRGGQLRSWRGRVLSALPAEELAAAGGGELPVGIHRGELQRLLLDHLPSDRVHLGSAVRGFAEDDGGVEVQLDGGEAFRGDALVGADGIHSAVRAQLLGSAPPRYAGYTCWRGVCGGGEKLLGDWHGGESWGPGRRFGAVPIGGGRVYWFAVIDAPEGGTDPGDPKPVVRQKFAGFHEPVVALIDATPSDAILRNDIHDRPPIDTWGAGRVTLLGDAAHAMTPNLGQGACQAIEDAVALGRHLDGATEVATVLRAYEQARRARANRFVREAWRFGRIGQLESATLRGLRDLLFRLQPASLTVRSIRWMFDRDAA